MQTAVKGATDCDKIKMNVVRAIGNLLQLIKSDLIMKTNFMQIVDESFTVLTKNCTSGSNMKVSLVLFYQQQTLLENRFTGPMECLLCFG